ncbi:ankyrin repeat domain-containing protein [Candidatus Babeliales bacterium]|nr:ankyrin repeat domain-containing protein [Candidatus Babeliales bacterium]
MKIYLSLIFFLALSSSALPAALSLEEQLFEAVYKNLPEKMHPLLAQGANPNTRNNQNNTPLLWAAKNGRAECLRLLLECEKTDAATIDARDVINRSALHLAAKGGHLECLRLLLAKNADINAYGYQDSTPLHAAAQEGHSECVALLINAGAEVDVVNLDGQTALHCTAISGNSGCVTLLLQAGADANAVVTSDCQGHLGATALDLALRFKNTECAAVLGGDADQETQTLSDDESADY